MASTILLPQVGQDIETATIVEWRVNENDYVKKGDIVVVVQSDKADFEVEAYESGVLLKILYQEGQEARVLQPIAYLGEPGERIEDLETMKSDESKPTRQAITTLSNRTEASKRISASPAARRIAREHGVDLSQIKGSGPAGRIVKKDILAIVYSATPDTQEVSAGQDVMTTNVGSALLDDVEIPFSRMRQRIAERLTQSKQTIPHFYVFIDVDMTAALSWRAEHNTQSQSRISINDIVVASIALALTEYRRLNGHVVENKLIQRKEINIGVAVSTEDGLLVPVIPEADKKDIQEISRLSRENSEKARSGVLKSMTSATFTISNLGVYSIRSVLPIINPPQCAILGVGGIEKRVVPFGDNSIGIRDMLTLSLACDHRVIDGAYAARFLNTTKKRLENFCA